MEIRIGEETYKAELNAFTPIVYSRCFTTEGAKGLRRPKDINEAIGAVLEVNGKYGFPPVLPLLEVLYACIKTADPKFDAKFEDWVSSLPMSAFDLQVEDGWASDVTDLIQQNFFPNAAAGVETEAAEAPGTAAAGQPA